MKLFEVLIAYKEIYVKINTLLGRNIIKIVTVLIGSLSVQTQAFDKCTDKVTVLKY